MHVHRCMGTKTISLEDSAYEKLRAAKRPGESLSDVIRRVFGSREPSLVEFSRLLDRRDAEDVAASIRRMREEDLGVQRPRLAPRR